MCFFISRLSCCLPRCYVLYLIGIVHRLPCSACMSAAASFADCWSPIPPILSLSFHGRLLKVGLFLWVVRRVRSDGFLLRGDIFVCLWKREGIVSRRPLVENAVKTWTLLKGRAEYSRHVFYEHDDTTALPRPTPPTTATLVLHNDEMTLPRYLSKIKTYKTPPTEHLPSYVIRGVNSVCKASVEFIFIYYFCSSPLFYLSISVYPSFSPSLSLIPVHT